MRMDYATASHSPMRMDDTGATWKSKNSGCRASYTKANDTEKTTREQVDAHARGAAESHSPMRMDDTENQKRL